MNAAGRLAAIATRSPARSKNLLITAALQVAFDEGLPQRKWGPALLPAPTAPSEGSAGVRNLVPGDPCSILAHQLRRRLASNCYLVRGARPIYSKDNPEDHQSFGLSGLALEPKPSDVPRPFLG